MTLSKQLRTRSQLLSLLSWALDLDHGYYVLEFSGYDRRQRRPSNNGPVSASAHRDGSWHVTPSGRLGLAADLNWETSAGVRNNPTEWRHLATVAHEALRRGFSITFPKTATQYVAGHSGSNLHLHIDCGSYSRIDNREGDLLTANIPGATFLRYAHKPAAVKHPATRALRSGDRGARVETLQRRLNLLYPLYSDLAPDGVFGLRTAAVVREFQKRRGLVVDGIVGPKTAHALGL